MIADLARDLACAGDLRAAHAELRRWRSEWSAWQRGWYAFLEGDLARADRELRDPSLDRLIDARALLRTRVMLAALRRTEARRRELCASAPSATPPAACGKAAPALARLDGRLLLPRGATAEVLLFPEGFENSAIARDPFLVYRNLSFFHARARAQAGGRFSFPRLVPGRYLLISRVSAELPPLSGGQAEVELRPGERRRLEPLAITSGGSTGSRSR